MKKFNVNRTQTKTNWMIAKYQRVYRIIYISLCQISKTFRTPLLKMQN